MAQSLRQIKNRIRGTENTRKVTSAMQMISVAKLNRIDDMLLACRAYAQRLEDFFQYICALNYGEQISAFMRTPPENARVVLCLFTSDTGLCGVYNNNIMRFAEEFIRTKKDREVELFIIGRRGVNYFSNRGYPVEVNFQGLNGRFSPEAATALAGKIMDVFLSQRSAEIYLCYTRFESALMLRPVIERLLPFSRNAEINSRNCIFESEPEAIVKELIPRQIFSRLRLAFFEAFTSEHAARTVAMKAATDNAKDLLERLILMRNKVRQAGITQDIMEIISSAEALKG